jgi:L-ascorbate metabolism protein UlaG (beta-lactamase superfamily)
MRITKFGHACVRIESAGKVVVLDPGNLSEREAVDGATAVLVTHEHADHLDLEHLRATEAPVFTIGAVAHKIAAEAPDLSERVTVVRPGENFDAGVPVRAVGEWHAVIHEELPGFYNSGFLVSVEGREVYHPGDAFTVPDEPVDVLLAPVSGPWNKLAEVIDFARDVGAAQTVAIHDRIASDVGLGIVDGRMQAFLHDRGLDYVRVPDGADVPLEDGS